MQSVQLFETIFCGVIVQSDFTAGFFLTGTSAKMALSDECGTACSAVVANADEPQIQSCAAEPVPLFQLVTGGNPPRRDDVRQISAVATER